MVEYKTFEIERLKVWLIASVQALYHWPFSLAAHIKRSSPLSVLPLSSAPNGHCCLMWLTCCFLSPACLDQRLLIWWQTRKQPELRHKEGGKLLCRSSYLTRCVPLCAVWMSLELLKRYQARERHPGSIIHTKHQN